MGWKTIYSKNCERLWIISRGANKRRVLANHLAAFCKYYSATVFKSNLNMFQLIILPRKPLLTVRKIYNPFNLCKYEDYKCKKKCGSRQDYSELALCWILNLIFRLLFYVQRRFVSSRSQSSASPFFSSVSFQIYLTKWNIRDDRFMYVHFKIMIYFCAARKSVFYKQNFAF